MREQFAAWVEEYSLALLRWARGKTGDHIAAEDLAQEVWLQFFSAARREMDAARAISQPEHLLWKVARHVWLKSLRQKEYLPLSEDSPDPEDFPARLADAQEQAQLEAWVHQRVVNLNRLQREIFILYYVEQVPQKEIARRLGVNESTLRWHLSDTRRKI